MSERRLGIIMNGVTGRMGRNQHLERSVLAIMREGGLPLADGSRVMPDPILVGRDEGRVAALARAYGIARWTADLDAALADPDDRLFFDTAHTGGRAERLERAVAAGKDVYCEKPAASDLAGALAAWRAARDAGVRHGVVQDKLWMPGVRKLRRLVDAGFFGRILSVPRRVRILGVRGRPPAGPAPVLELPGSGGGRHHPRHALPLALPHRQHLRPHPVGELPRRDPHPAALGRGGRPLRGHRGRRRLRDVRA